MENQSVVDDIVEFFRSEDEIVQNNDSSQITVEEDVQFTDLKQDYQRIEKENNFASLPNLQEAPKEADEIPQTDKVGKPKKKIVKAKRKGGYAVGKNGEFLRIQSKGRGKLAQFSTENIITIKRRSSSFSSLDATEEEVINLLETSLEKQPKKRRRQESGKEEKELVN